jgi:hypothetical protein
MPAHNDTGNPGFGRWSKEETEDLARRSQDWAREKKGYKKADPASAAHEGNGDNQQRQNRHTGSEPGGDGRPQIEITTEEHVVNEAAANALGRDLMLYQRGGVLVRITRDASPAAHGVRRPLGPRIEPLPPALLRERLAANARWVKENGSSDRPPGWCVSAVHARGDWPGVRHLEAVIEYPILRPDGTLLATPGFDAATGLLLEPIGPLPTPPDRPTLADARAALDELSEVIADFPFAAPVHRSAWLAALLTPLARFAFIGPAPLFLADANVRAAGKGLLFDCISRIVTGERFTVATYTSDEDELRKRITSIVLAGDRLVMFDNLSGNFGNGTLDAALTATSWRDRLLGLNRMVAAPIYQTWYATGNNVAVAADTARRICHIRLESPLERPEERSDVRHRDLLGWVGANRGRLLAAALTILRGNCAAGRPDMQLPAWGSFEGWSRLVRTAVVWVGLPDPGETRIILQDRADVAAESMGVILACWALLDPDRKGLTAAQVIRALYPPRSEKLADPPAWHDDFRAALESIVGRPDTRSLGNRLRHYRRRIFEGRYLDIAAVQHRAARWAVFPAEQFGKGPKLTPQTPHTPPGQGNGGESGGCGESVFPQAETDGLI